MRWRCRRQVRRAVLIILPILALGEFFALYPIPLLPHNPAVAAEGRTYGPRPGFPVVLVMGETADAKTFRQADWSGAWANTLVQEISGCSVISVSRVDDDLLQDTSLLVLSRSASGQLAGTQVASLEKWVMRGGLAIVEQQSNTLSNLTGVSVAGVGEAWSPARVTKVAGSAQEWADLTLMPLVTSCMTLSKRADDTTVAMEMDDQPVVLVRHIGEGAVCTYLFDVGQQLTALQQGVPSKGFRVVDKRGAGGIVDAPDLICSSGPLDCSIPFADVLERWMVGLLEDIRAIPRMWYYPYDYDGAVAITHDEDWFGDASSFVTEHEKASNYSSTFFMIARGPLTSQGLDIMSGLGADIQIHWNREMLRWRDKAVRRWFVVFTRGDGSLRKQIRVLEEKLGGKGEVSLCRIHRLSWGGRYTRPYRIMEAAGVKLDSTLGPAGKTGRGYLFGTGLPFHPIDTNGKLFSLLEVPFQIQARYSGVDRSYIGDLLRNSSVRYHEIITALYHPSDLVEGSPVTEDWYVFHELARQENHWMITLSDLVGWWTARQAVEIGNVKWNGTSLSYDCAATLDRMAIIVPLSHNGLAISSIFVDSGPAQATRTISLQGRQYVLVRIDQGRHFISVVYR